jgi:hypothetical protein
MVKSRAGSLALVTPFAADDAAGEFQVVANGSDRRAHARLNPLELSTPLSARLKYGETVTLIDVSVGGALLETTNALRPEADLVLEIVDSRTHDVVPIVSRVLRCHVSQLKGGGIHYRGACAFKRPLTHPALLATASAPSQQAPESVDFVKLEFALKTIVESYMGRSSGDPASQLRDGIMLLDALERLRAAALRRDDQIDRQLAELLSVIIPALRRNESPDAVMRELQQHMRRHVPLLGIRPIPAQEAPTSDRELITLSMWSGGDAKPSAVTAEFPMGFGLDESQFRLLKAGAYLTGLVGQWRSAAPEPVQPVVTTATLNVVSAPVEAPPPAPKPAVAAEGVPESQDLPSGWQRVVIRYADGNLLRGYTNDFHPERAHLHLCPTVNCPVGERLLVPIGRLKAVFFVKDLLGNPDHVSSNTFDHSPRARKVEVTFRDDEVIAGSTLNYKPSGQGFYLHPADSQGNNVRVYVVTAAVRHMRFI